MNKIYKCKNKTIFGVDNPVYIEQDEDKIIELKDAYERTMYLTEEAAYSVIYALAEIIGLELH